MRTLPLLFAALLNAACASRAELQTTSEDPCSLFTPVSASQRWIPGDHKIVPVTFERQAEMMQRLKRGALEEVDEAFAESIAGRPILPNAAHYYLVRVGYYGEAPAGRLRAGLDLSADIGADGTAYVSSFVLSQSPKTSELAAILTSPLPLKRLIMRCGAAE